MSHGIDVCQCGAVLRQCRCIGPHIPRVVTTECPVCKEKPGRRTVKFQFSGAVHHLSLSEADALIETIKAAIAESAAERCRVEVSP